MTQNFAFETDELLIAESVSILVGSTDPSVALVDRPIGSIYIRSSGEVWQKVGELSNQWVRLEAGAGGSGISELQHSSIMQLIHFIDEGPAEGFVSGCTKETQGTILPYQEIWRRADSTKLLVKSTTWVGITPTQIVWTLYDTDGITELVALMDTITYNGIFEVSRVRTLL